MLEARLVYPCYAFRESKKYPNLESALAMIDEIGKALPNFCS